MNQESFKDYFNDIFNAFIAIKVGKIFGLWPINIDSKQPNEIIFKWKNYRTAISMFFCFWALFTAFGTLKSQLNAGALTPSNIVGVIFASVCFTISIIFFKIAIKFRKLIVFWHKVEQIFFCEKYDYPESRWPIRKRIKVFMWIFLAAATLEHLFYLSSEGYKLYFEFNYCNITDADSLEIFIQRHLSFVLTNIPIPYNNVLGIFAEFFNVSLTFWWNYLDLFIILVSIGLADLFEKISWRMECLKNVPISDILWDELRTHHVEVCELVLVINEIFGFAFMLACCNDGYFILIQMLNITM